MVLLLLGFSHEVQPFSLLQKTMSKMGKTCHDSQQHVASVPTKEDKCAVFLENVSSWSHRLRFFFFFSSNVAETFRHLGCKRSKIDTNCPKIPKQQPHMHVRAFVRCVYPRRLDTGTQCTVHANTWASSHICHKTLCCSHPYAAYITLPKKTHLTQPSPQS